MTQQQQLTFVADITESLKNELFKKLNQVPENWDGCELRQWIADYYEANYVDRSKLTGKRKKDYKNDLLINNLY